MVSPAARIALGTVDATVRQLWVVAMFALRGLCRGPDEIGERGGIAGMTKLTSIATVDEHDKLHAWGESIGNAGAPCSVVSNWRRV